MQTLLCSGVEIARAVTMSISWLRLFFVLCPAENVCIFAPILGNCAKIAGSYLQNQSATNVLAISGHTRAKSEERARANCLYILSNRAIFFGKIHKYISGTDNAKKSCTKKSHCERKLVILSVERGIYEEKGEAMGYAHSGSSHDCRSGQQ